jgi:hypothetical protein
VAKDKDKKDKKAKLKIPKQVAGVKVPKKLRKAGKKAIDLAAQPAVSEAVAAAMLAAAAALREGKDGRTTMRAAADAAGEVGREAGREAGKLGDALRLLAIDLARRTAEAWAESARKEKVGVAPHQKRQRRAEGDSSGADGGSGEGA